MDDLPRALLDQIVQVKRALQFRCRCLTVVRFLRTFRHGGGVRLLSLLP